MANGGDWQTALALYDLVLDLSPDHDLALGASASLIASHELRSLYGRAVNRLHKVVSLSRADHETYFQLAMLSAKVGSPLTSVEGYLSASVKANSHFPEALYNLALVHYRQANLVKSIEILQKLLTLTNDRHIKGLLLLADIYVDGFNDLKRGEQCYQRVLTLNDGHLMARHNLCVISVRLNRLQDAISCFESLQQQLINGQEEDELKNPVQLSLERQDNSIRGEKCHYRTHSLAGKRIQRCDEQRDEKPLKTNGQDFSLDKLRPHYVDYSNEHNNTTLTRHYVIGLENDIHIDIEHEQGSMRENHDETAFNSQHALTGDQIEESLQMTRLLLRREQLLNRSTNEVHSNYLK